MHPELCNKNRDKNLKLRVITKSGLNGGIVSSFNNF